MHQTRHLLLDCRAALRRADPGFEDTPLGDRLDAAILEMGKVRDAQRVQEQAAPEHPVASRVAYAWQGVARELRHTHPEVYQRLWEQVLKRLDVQAMDDPAEEIAALKASLDRAQQAVAVAEGEVAGLREALAAAIANPAPAPAPSAGNVVHGVTDEDTPGPALLQAVASGTRRFAPHQLEWCLGEALVRTGFQKTPVQLLEQGEPGLARLLLEATAEA